MAKIAHGYRGYGLPLSDLISEGNVGLMQGVKKFEPDRGFRLATYAMWWIKASIQEFILRGWSLVKIGTTAAQKKLFFNLRRMKRQLDAYEDSDLHPDDVTKIATDLGVPEQEVINMNRRMMMGGDASLNVSHAQRRGRLGPVAGLAGRRHARCRTRPSPMPKRRRCATRCSAEAMDSLNEREKHILTERRLIDDPQTLEELSQHYDVSRERIRQIEVRAFEKLQKAMQRIAGEKLLPSAGLQALNGRSGRGDRVPFFVIGAERRLIRCRHFHSRDFPAKCLHGRTGAALFRDGCSSGSSWSAWDWWCCTNSCPRR